MLRDSASANRNGIVWADDLDDMAAYGEVLRASTSNGTASKMDMDRNGIRNTRIVAPILISGEQLGMGTQKALADRAVVISAPSPVGRMSLHDPKRIQWLDIQDLMGRYSGVDGLSVLAGWYQQQALSQVEEAITALSAEKQDAKGRHGDKVAVLLAGAKLLDSLLGHPGAWEGKGPNYSRVQKWATGAESPLLADNTLTMEILPWALRTFHVHDQPESFTMGRFQNIDTPVFVRFSGDVDLEGNGGTEVWVSASLLSDAWNRDNNRRVDSRTATNAAIGQQLDRVTVPNSSKPFKVAGTGRSNRYRKLLPEYAQIVLQRSEVSVTS